MIKSINLSNVGPRDTLQLELGARLNIFTGDNGLGKSFLLDIMWWALTRSWPQEINREVRSGYIAKPIDIKKPATIKFDIVGKTKSPRTYEAEYSPRDEMWIGKAGRPINPGLVIYTMSDGSFALWDPAQNYWNPKSAEQELRIRPPAQVYSQTQIWEGYSDQTNKISFDGLIRDWALWQTGKESRFAEQFSQLKSLLLTLSSENERIEIGELQPFTLDDTRLYPTIKMPYGQEILLPYASSGIKRIITFAYFLVYAWKRHCESVRLLGEEPTRQITFLIDEMEAHLHPKWQRRIVPAILSVMQELSPDSEIQLITATHSPLVMASLEPLFDEEKDAWFDFDLEQNRISIKRRHFEKHGTAENWLHSEAFDLNSSRAISYSNLIEEAKEMISSKRVNAPSKTEIEEMRIKLSQALEPTDSFLFRWRAICEKKGWLA